MPRGNALTTKAISLVVHTPIPKVTEVAMVVAVEVTMEEAALTTTSRIIGHPTTVVVVATGCTTVVCTKEGATATGSNAKDSTKVLVRSEHLVVLLSPQVMVVQERTQTMTSSTIGSTSKNVNFPRGLLSRSSPESDEQFSACKW
jgi:hypothetical protein